MVETTAFNKGRWRQGSLERLVILGNQVDRHTGQGHLGRALADT
jgi:hypothetical protein